MMTALTLIACLSAMPNASAQTPEEGNKALAYYLGTWQYEWEVEGKKYHGTWVVKRSPSDACNLSHWSSVGPDGPAQGTKITGWDAAKRQIVDLDFSSSGQQVLARYSILSDKVELGQGVGSQDGKVLSSKLRVDKKPNEFTWTLTDQVNGDESLPDLKFVFKRVEAPAVRRSQDEEATAQAFQQLGKLLVGRWKSDIKFIADWAGEKEGKGAVVHGFAEFVWRADKQLITAVETGGEQGGYWTIMHNPVSKKIRLFIKSTRGSAIEAEMWQTGENVFAWRVTDGGEPDGKALTGSGQYVFSEDGKKVTMKGDLELGGEPLAPYKDVYYRLSPVNE